ncbi:hypothetical protein [Fodinicola feengrottensis]|uniref:hypothetical protein n=1 Tax=Fodinicola feengrottensis TaxID=435914 RepID=UPI0024414C83|nr:hypothetical protein [Fodinicola feengrottensis]
MRLTIRIMPSGTVSIACAHLSMSLASLFAADAKLPPAGSCHSACSAVLVDLSELDAFLMPLSACRQAVAAWPMLCEDWEACAATWISCMSGICM